MAEQPGSTIGGAPEAGKLSLLVGKLSLRGRHTHVGGLLHSFGDLAAHHTSKAFLQLLFARDLL